MKRKIVHALLIGIVPTGVVSFTVMSINLGYIEGFFRIWLRSWAIAYVIMVPIIFLLTPLIDRFVRFLFREKGTFDQ